jgi:hypothetical protein
MKRLKNSGEKVHADFDGKVLRDEVLPNPPVRGMYGYAYIPLKEDAEAKRQKPFYVHGERQEAMKKITQDWVDKKFIERPQKGVEWLCQGFAVPKKSTNFHGGGWLTCMASTAKQSDAITICQTLRTFC